MSEPILPLPVGKTPDTAGATSGEGAQTALAAMIRKRKMGENHIDTDKPEAAPVRTPPLP